jgi:hypothetical protein
MYCVSIAQRATVSVFQTVRFSHARYPSGNRTASI